MLFVRRLWRGGNIEGYIDYDLYEHHRIGDVLGSFRPLGLWSNMMRKFWLGNRTCLALILLVLIPASYFTVPLTTHVQLNLAAAVMILVACGLFIRYHDAQWSMFFLTIIGVWIANHLSTYNPQRGVYVDYLTIAFLLALLAVIFNPARAAVIAYVGATFGVLLGADFLRVIEPHSIRSLFSIQSTLIIGGAGLSDAVVATGAVAAIFAAVIGLWVQAART